MGGGVKHVCRDKESTHDKGKRSFNVHVTVLDVDDGGGEEG